MRSGKRNTMKLIDAGALHKAYMELRNFKQNPQSGDWISLRAVPLTTVIRMLNEAPIIETKQVKYFDEEEKVWKVGSVIVNE